MTRRDTAIYYALSAAIYGAIVAGALVSALLVITAGVVVAWLASFDTGRIVLVGGVAIIAAVVATEAKR